MNTRRKGVMARAKRVSKRPITLAPVSLHCRVCGTRILTCELCEECAKGNDPFTVATNCGKDLRP